jgi:hypothetical protein
MYIYTNIESIGNDSNNKFEIIDDSNVPIPAPTPLSTSSIPKPSI